MLKMLVLPVLVNMVLFQNENLFMCIFIDKNECDDISPPCDLNARCNNTIGSYECTCNVGYSGDGKTCAGKYI